MDVIGWFEPGTGAGYVALDPPVRDLDTRSGNGPRLGPLGSGEVHELEVARYYGVPADAAAVMISTIAVSPTQPGFLTVYPAGPRPGSSSLNFVAGAIVPNAVISGLGEGGRVAIYNLIGFTHVVCDLSGFFLDPALVPVPD